MYKGWEGFTTGKWSDRVDVRDFIQRNYTEYTGDEAFLAPATESTLKLWKIVMELSKKEAEAGGVLDMDTGIVSSITSHGPGYLDRELETIVGFQTDKPLKRSLQAAPLSLSLRPNIIINSALMRAFQRCLPVFHPLRVLKHYSRPVLIFRPSLHRNQKKKALPILS